MSPTAVGFCQNLNQILEALEGMSLFFAPENGFNFSNDPSLQ
jgi:hypothetical protein